MSIFWFSSKYLLQIVTWSTSRPTHFWSTPISLRSKRSGDLFIKKQLLVNVKSIRKFTFGPVGDMTVDKKWVFEDSWSRDWWTVRVYVLHYCFYCKLVETCWIPSTSPCRQQSLIELGFRQQVGNNYWQSNT